MGDIEMASLPPANNEDNALYKVKMGEGEAIQKKAETIYSESNKTQYDLQNRITLYKELKGTEKLLNYDFFDWVVSFFITGWKQVAKNQIDTAKTTILSQMHFMLIKPPYNGTERTIENLTEILKDLNDYRTKGSQIRLYKAIEKGDLDAVKFETNFNKSLLNEYIREFVCDNKHIITEGTPLFLAVHCKNKEIVKFLLEQGANTKIRSTLHTLPERGSVVMPSVTGSPLRLAILEKNLEMIKMLLEEKNNISNQKYLFREFIEDIELKENITQQEIDILNLFKEYCENYINQNKSLKAEELLIRSDLEKIIDMINIILTKNLD